MRRIKENAMDLGWTKTKMNTGPAHVPVYAPEPLALPKQIRSQQEKAKIVLCAPPIISRPYLLPFPSPRVQIVGTLSSFILTYEVHHHGSRFVEFT